MTRGRRAVLAAGFALLAAMLAVTAVNAIFGVGGHAARTAIRDWVSSGVYLLVAGIVLLRALKVDHRRLPWVIFAIGLSTRWVTSSGPSGSDTWRTPRSRRSVTACG